MIDETKIIKTIEHCKKSGYSVRVRDIAYVFLCSHISDKKLAYRMIFGEDCPDIQSYDSSSGMSYLKNYIEYNIERKAYKNKTQKDDDLISFEENRAAMVDLLKQTQSAMDNGEIEPKDGLKILADLRVKLNDKFNVNEVIKDQLVIVEPKYNRICERFNVECYMPTKEQLMEMYNLTEKKENA